MCNYVRVCVYVRVLCVCACVCAGADSGPYEPVHAVAQLHGQRYSHTKTKTKTHTQNSVCAVSQDASLYVYLCVCVYLLFVVCAIVCNYVCVCLYVQCCSSLHASFRRWAWGCLWGASTRYTHIHTRARARARAPISLWFTLPIWLFHVVIICEVCLSRGGRGAAHAQEANLAIVR